MSTRLIRRIIKEYKTGECVNELFLTDDFESESYGVLDKIKDFPESDIDCLKMCIEEQLNMGYNNEILQDVFENKRGITIDGNVYYWEDIEPLFKNWELTE